MNDSPISVAVVGAGSMAREHIRAFQSLPGVTIAGLHSRTRAKAEALAAEFRIAKVCDSTESLYAATEADLVVNTVFETSMKSVALECCRLPWTLLLEKPPGMHLAEARQIQAAAEKAGRTVLVGLNRRFLNSSLAAFDDLADRPGPRFIHVQDQQDLEVARILKHPPEVVENWMFANSIHLVDYLRYFGRGDILDVTPIAGWNPREPGVVLARVDFSSGDVGLYEALWNGPGPWAVTVSTPQKRWEMRPLEEAKFQNAGERKLHVLPAAELDAQFKPGFRRQAEHAVAAVRKLPHRSTHLAEALQTMKLIADIYFTKAAAASRAA